MARRTQTIAHTFSVGEEAALARGYTNADYRRVRITRISPTGRIVVAWPGGSTSMFNPDGTEYGTGNRSSTPATATPYAACLAPNA